MVNRPVMSLADRGKDLVFQTIALQSIFIWEQKNECILSSHSTTKSTLQAFSWNNLPSIFVLSYSSWHLCTQFNLTANCSNFYCQIFRREHFCRAERCNKNDDSVTRKKCFRFLCHKTSYWSVYWKVIVQVAK